MKITTEMLKKAEIELANLIEKEGKAYTKRQTFLMATINRYSKQLGLPEVWTW